jgi:hypothetical protein
MVRDVIHEEGFLSGMLNLVCAHATRDDWLVDGGAVIIGSEFTNPVIAAKLVVIRTYTNFVPFLAAMRMRRAFSLMKPSASFWL